MVKLNIIRVVYSAENIGGNCKQAGGWCERRQGTRRPRVASKRYLWKNWKNPTACARLHLHLPLRLSVFIPRSHPYSKENDSGKKATGGDTWRWDADTTAPVSSLWSQGTCACVLGLFPHRLCSCLQINNRNRKRTYLKIDKGCSLVSLNLKTIYYWIWVNYNATKKG